MPLQPIRIFLSFAIVKNTYAELCKVNITSERTSYFEHTVIIASERFENMEDAVKRISELRNKAAAIRKRL